MDTLYPELIDYIYEYCEAFMSEHEQLAKKTFIYTNSVDSASMRSIMLRKKWISDDPQVLRLMEGGEEAMKKKIVSRIWHEHEHVLNLNLCPACKKIARTPLARQCRYCAHDWH